MAENALRWPMVDGTYYVVALVVLLGGDMDFKIVDGFVMALKTGLTLVLVNVKGLGGGGGGRSAERTNGFKQVLPSDVDLESFWRH